MNQVYVTDLDGTAFSDRGVFSYYTQETIKGLVKEGVNFTVASGRGNYAINILRAFRLKLPIILLNGATMYDFGKQQFIMSKSIAPRVVRDVLRATKNQKLDFSKMRVLIKSNLRDMEQRDYNGGDVLVIHFRGEEQKVRAIAGKIKDIGGLETFVFPSHSSRGDWYCEINVEGASKKDSISWLKSEYNFDKVTVFGDSDNDIGMAEVANVFCVTENGTDSTKAVATKIIGANSTDSVAKYIYYDYKNSKPIRALLSKTGVWMFKNPAVIKEIENVENIGVNERKF